ncbi:MAG: hypothetical protein ACXWWE_09190 [Nitrospira sp.]
MNSGQFGIDQTKIQTIRECLEKQFVGVQFSFKDRPTFVFNNGGDKQSWNLIFNEAFLADHHTMERLKQFVDRKVIPKIQQNPGKRIQVSNLGDITVEERKI